MSAISILASVRQKVMSVWQSEVQMILTRTSYAFGGSTTISSMVSGSPAPLQTAAACCRQWLEIDWPQRMYVHHIHGERDEVEAAAEVVPLQRIGLGLWSSMASSRRDPGDGEGGGGLLKRDLTTNGVTTSEFERT